MKITYGLVLVGGRASLRIELGFLEESLVAQ